MKKIIIIGAGAMGSAFAVISSTQIGDSAFKALSHSIKDIKLKPTNNLELFIASNQGLYQN